MSTGTEAHAGLISALIATVLKVDNSFTCSELLIAKFSHVLC